jgi:hydrogenase nickel incorporation protein HypA/HybF
MHEVGLARAIVAAAERRAAGRPVRAVHVRVGALHRALPEPMRFAFESLVAGTPLDGAQLDVVTVPVASTCRSCGEVEEAAEPTPTCLRCGDSAVDFAGGDELQLVAVELAMPEPTVAVG